MSNSITRSGWKTVKTKDVLNGIITGKKDVNQAIASGAYPFFSCARETSLFSNDYILNTDAILISGNGSYTGFVKSYSGRFDLYQRTYALHGFKKGVNWRFIYYIFKYFFERRFLGGTTGAAIPYITKPVITDFEFLIPEKEDVQNKITSTLSAYDDLIENNQRRMKLLEESARLLYREWFVHLRFPGHEHTKIIDGVPEGWEKKLLEELAEINRDSLPGSYDGVIEYVDISSVDPGKITETTILHFQDAPSRARRIVQHGDIIWSCVRPNRRSHAVIWNPSENLIASTGFAVITPQSTPTSFTYYSTTTDAFVSYLGNRARGAAYPAVTAKDFQKAEILIPKPNLLDLFDETIEPMFYQIDNLLRQNQKLREARDLLLPRLMSGEITV